MYRTVDAAFWSDPTIKSLEKDGKLLALYLITNPLSHLGGIYYLPEAIVIDETGIPKSKLDTLWHTLSDTPSDLETRTKSAPDTHSVSGFALRDAKTQVVFVRRMFHYQGRGEKNERCVASHLKTLHKSFLIKHFLDAYPSVKRFVSDTLSDTLSDTPSDFGTQNRNRSRNRNRTGTEPEASQVVVSEANESEAVDEFQMPETLTASPEFNAAWQEFIDYRKRDKRKPVTPRAAKLLANQFEAWGPAAAVQAIHESIRNGWQGVFPPKTDRVGSLHSVEDDPRGNGAALAKYIGGLQDVASGN